MCEFWTTLFVPQVRNLQAVVEVVVIRIVAMGVPCNQIVVVGIMSEMSKSVLTEVWNVSKVISKAVQSMPDRSELSCRTPSCSPSSSLGLAEDG